MDMPLMPKATAVWLIDNTRLTFEQIGAFCGLHMLEVQALADGDIGAGINGRDPIAYSELTLEEIARCEALPDGRLVMAKRDSPRATGRSTGPRYTPVAKRQDKPDGIAWLLRNRAELSDAQVGKLIGTHHTHAHTTPHTRAHTHAHTCTHTHTRTHTHAQQHISLQWVSVLLQKEIGVPLYTLKGSTLLHIPHTP